MQKYVLTLPPVLLIVEFGLIFQVLAEYELKNITLAI
jgi:hypothetical protein